MKLRLTHFREKWESVFRWKCAGNFLERALPVGYNTGCSGALLNDGVEMSNKKKPLVVLTRKLPDPVETRMRELFDARLNIDDHRMNQPEIIAAMKEADVLVPCITDVIDAAAIEQAGPNLKLIANFGNGVDNIDVAAAAKRGITVTNTPNVLTEDTADMTLALLLSVPRRLVEGANVLGERHGQWRAGLRHGCSDGASGASASGSSAWDASARLSPAAPRLSGFPFTITTASASILKSRKNWKRPIGIASTRCWPGWISSRSTALRRLPHSICCPHAASR